ncbi:MAG: class I SAM-dependent methyltransferase [Actinobacteria bacterium]|nr:class I SAM-dependent methyltransferase [Actinomycetota bacterium]
MPSRSSVRRARRRLAELGPPRERSAGDYANIALPSADADVLVGLLSQNARSVIEVGLAYGSSVLAIAKSLAAHEVVDARHVIIDPHQALFDHVGVEVLAEAGLDGFYQLMEEESQVALPRLVARCNSFHAAFVDGSHKFHNVFVDLYYLQRLVVAGGLIVLDDCNWASVATAIDYFVQNMQWHHEPLKARTRLTAFRLPDPPADPRFREFRPFGAGARCWRAGARESAPCRHWSPGTCGLAELGFFSVGWGGACENRTSPRSVPRSTLGHRSAGVVGRLRIEPAKRRSSNAPPGRRAAEPR